MKKYFLLVSIILISLTSNAQLCYFTATQVGNPNTFDFIPNNTSYPNAALLWNFGDGSSMVSPQPTHTFAQSGNYTVTMSVLDSTNAIPLCSYTQMVSISFCNLTFSQDSTNNFIYYFSDIVSSNLTQVDWEFGDNSIGSGSSVSHQYNVPGIYTVICTETINGVVFCTSSVTIQVGASCSFQVSSPSPSSPSYVKLFTAIVPSSTGLISWDFGDGSPIVQGNAIQKSYANAGTYNVCMTYINGLDTCTSCSAVTITTNSGANCFFNATPITNSTYNFSAGNVNSPNVFTFDFGDGNTQSGNGIISHTYAAPGVYLACMSEIDTMGVVLCTSCLPITVQGNATNCQPNFTYSHSGLDAYFINQSVAFPNGGVPVSYAWDFGDGGTSSSAFPHHLYNAVGVYNVCLTVSTSNCTTTYCDSVLIDTITNPNGNPCNAQFAFTQLNPYQISAVVLNPANSLNYSWNFGDGSPLVNQLLTSHAYTNLGSYNVCLTVSSFLGCTSTYCDSLTVDSLGNIIYKGISTGFTLQTTTPTVLTGLNNNAVANTIQLLPNPAHSQITISGNTSEINSYVLMNAIGQQIESGSFINHTYTLDVNELSQGVYVLRLINKNGNIINQKFLKN
jgi:PKD repeat protein